MKFSGYALALGLLGAPAMAADLGKTDTPIKLAMTEQPGSQITAHVAAEVLKAAGYSVDLVDADEMSVFRQMDRGLIDANLEIWPANAVPSYEELVREGRLVELGELGVTPVEGLAYPAHMQNTCPGLPALEALRDCAAEFSGGTGTPVLIDYPVEWEGPGADLMTALDMPFETRPAASEAALVDALVTASENGDPVLAMFWQPHWAVAAHDLRFVELPVAEAACYEDPGFGPNKDAIGDCGFPALTTVKSVVRGFKTRWPAAYFLLEDFQIDNETQANLMVATERDGLAVSDVAANWAAENEDLVRSLIDSATQ